MKESELAVLFQVQTAKFTILLIVCIRIIGEMDMRPKWQKEWWTMRRIMVEIR